MSPEEPHYAAFNIVVPRRAQALFVTRVENARGTCEYFSSRSLFFAPGGDEGRAEDALLPKYKIYLAAYTITTALALLTTPRAALADPPTPPCEGGKQAAPDAPGRCCWPGQIWSASREVCVGVPRCPAGMLLRHGECAREVVDQAKRADIRKLLKLMGSARMGVQATEQLVRTYQIALPQVPPSFWRQLSAQITEDALIELIVPIYDRHLSHDDVRALLTFYASPAGQRFLKAMPEIQHDSHVAGQRWGVQLTRQIEEQVKKQTIRPTPKPAPADTDDDDDDDDDADMGKKR